MQQFFGFGLGPLFKKLYLNYCKWNHGFKSVIAGKLVKLLVLRQIMETEHSVKTVK